MQKNCIKTVVTLRIPTVRHSKVFTNVDTSGSRIVLYLVILTDLSKKNGKGSVKSVNRKGSWWVKKKKYGIQCLNGQNLEL